MQETNDVIVEKLSVKIYDTCDAMGRSAALDVEKKMIELLKEKGEINMIFASAPSQNEFLDALVQTDGIDWKRVNAFHMDEYIGLSANHPQRFANFLCHKLFNKVHFNNVFLLNPDPENPEKSCKEYASLLRKFPADIVCMGIGENNHIAFNDPHVADFEDVKLVKVIQLDDVSRNQQVHDGCFPSIDTVPKFAVTLTVPALVAAGNIYCIVPGENKATAVNRMIQEDITEKYPSTILKKHPNATLYLDKASAAKLSSTSLNLSKK